jgi:hypothetical protein
MTKIAIMTVNAIKEITRLVLGGDIFRRYELIKKTIAINPIMKYHSFI